MRIVTIVVLLAAVSGCTRWAMNSNLDHAYRAYQEGDCDRVMLDLSKVERQSRERRYVQPEVSMLRGQCLERQKLYVDAASTYQFLMNQYPASEYAYRAKARLDTLAQLGHYPAAQPTRAIPASK
ncbi:tetratricopeptide repeat protein [Pseudomonas viridiflava]|uniref:tetratricopeptide repeat protein n=1 Tax=Pseudomonas viridiflava TaxID=33069 RepID=UPI0018E60BE0|nr:tetratricopeptide repeat protein [Pseudomonas viridiflava]MBI6705930.1 tetratricopeptide repeat protein [Pseudomonas viridiflava]MBI6724362.1 tetratricopeptide repeat protein [Pseudomonas viridiflava]